MTDRDKRQLGAIIEAEDSEEDEEGGEGGLTDRSNATKKQGLASKLSICASVNIGKLRFQIFEATDIREELVRRLDERLQ